MSRIDEPCGPETSIADVGVSTCLDLTFVLGISAKLRLTSAGIEIGVNPIREGHDDDVENGL